MGKSIICSQTLNRKSIDCSCLNIINLISMLWGRGIYFDKQRQLIADHIFFIYQSDVYITAGKMITNQNYIF